MKTLLIAVFGCQFALSCGSFAQEIPDIDYRADHERVYVSEERPEPVTQHEESYDKPSEIRLRLTNARAEMKRVVRKPPPKPSFDATMPMANETVSFRR